MKLKVTYIIVGLVIIAAGAISLLYASRSSHTTRNNQPSSEVPGQYADFLGNANVSGIADKSKQPHLDIIIKDFSFSPTIVTIHKDTTVTWTNQDTVRHNIMSSSDSKLKGLSSPLLAKHESYSHTFSTAGTYYYFCEPHPTQMRGVIIVK